MSTSSKWWDINKILSYNKLLNFVVGLRGGGKTYGSKKKVIQNFIRKHKQFVYIRRYKSEMREAKKKFFDDVKQEFPDLNFKVENGQLIIMHDSDRVVFDGSHWTINGVSQGDGWFSVNIGDAEIINLALAERVLEKVEE